MNKFTANPGKAIYSFKASLTKVHEMANFERTAATWIQTGCNPAFVEPLLREIFEVNFDNH